MKKVNLLLLFLFMSLAAGARRVIRVEPVAGDCVGALQAALDQAAKLGGKPVVIELQPADYHLHRENATKRLYHISNTSSERENPDQTKHIGLLLKGLRNVTIDGRGARLVTHGEMTSLVVDGCSNITFKDFIITAADPTVAELTVEEVGDNWLTVRPHPQSRYEVSDGRFAFVGDSWRLPAGIGCMYDYRRATVLWSWSPLPEVKHAEELEPGLLRFTYDRRPEGYPGLVYQMRDGIRDEACALISQSRDVRFERVHFAFLGNFGVVGQVSENIAFSHVRFEPESESGRTCAGFADFIQMSGCKGLIEVENCRFNGAHDDPINIHGTHLSVREYPASNQVLLRYMHHQTYGFQSFLPGNVVEFVDAHSLLSVASAKVKRAEMKSEREILLTLDRDVPEDVRGRADMVVENATYTPDVVVRDNYFAGVPTRGLLVTTRGKVLVERNTFFRTGMHAIMIADDGRNWFESGMVRDVTIRNNRFIECGEPVVQIAPEYDRHDGCIHSNISILDNRFKMSGTAAVNASSVDGLVVRGNFFDTPRAATDAELVRTRDCRNVRVEDNRHSSPEE